MLQIILSTLILCHLVFYIAWKTDKFSVMDVAWGLGFVLVAIVGYLQNYSSPPKTLLLVMVCTWGLRLAGYIYLRSKGKPEDPRYTKMREQWGADYLKEGYKKVFMAQGAAMFVISLPVQLGMSSELEHFGFKQILGLLIWLVGFALECWSDYHLTQFRKNPANKGKACMDGPWVYVRFPNYLGEMMIWWGVWIYILNFWTAWTIVGPLTICYSLLKVTGIPMIENNNLRKEGYREYAARVPRLIPFLKPKPL